MNVPVTKERSFVGIERTREGLVALWVACDVERRISLSGEGEVVPFSCGIGILEGHDPRELEQAWQRLSDVCIEGPFLDASVLIDVLQVVLGSVVVGPMHSMGALPLVGNEPEARRATAAHPRAFQGTKYKPPKRAKPGNIDLRPYLLHEGDLRVVIEHFLSSRPALWPLALAQLDADGWPVTHLRSLDVAAEGIDELFDFVCSFRGSLSGEALSHAALPASFCRFLLPSLRGESLELVKQMLRHYWSLSLDEDDALLAAIAWLLQRDATAGALWCEYLACVMPHRRLLFVQMLVKHGVDAMAPRDLVADVPRLMELEELSSGTGSDTWYHLRLSALFESLRLGTSPAYMLGWFRLASLYQPDFAFSQVPAGAGPCMSGTEEAIIDLVCALEEIDSSVSSGLGLYLWRSCGLLPGLDELLCLGDWRRLYPDAALGWFDCLRDADFHRAATKHGLEAHFRFLCRWSERVIEVISALPPAHQKKAFAMVGDCCWGCCDHSEIESLLPLVLEWCERVCRPPFTTTRKSCAIHWLLCASCPSPEAFAVLQALPVSSIRRLEKEASWENRASLLLAGIRALRDGFPRRMWGWLDEHPKKFCHVASLLGSFRDEKAIEVVMAAANHDCFGSLPEALTEDIERLAQLMVSWMRDGGVNPIPKKLSLHLQGKLSLTDGQQKRCHEKLLSSLSLLQLDVLEGILLTQLADGYGADALEDTRRHALQMNQLIRDNRRGLRRFLRAYWRGECDYIEQHPASQRWLEQHPEIQAQLEVWTKGLDMVTETPSHGTIRISVEDDPLEVLKMGTYVGSCLGLGGAFAYSAVANVLDLNKQVLFARDEKGAVLARQLLAISNETGLVCFYVYPLETEDWLLALFKEYNERLEDVLDVFMHDQYDELEHRDVASILSEDWWFDCLWDD